MDGAWSDPIPAKSATDFAGIGSDHAPSIKSTPLILHLPLVKNGNEEVALKLL
jgi:hypothetical protein